MNMNLAFAVCLSLLSLTSYGEELVIPKAKLESIADGGFVRYEWQGKQVVGIVKRTSADVSKLKTVESALKHPFAKGGETMFDKSIPVEREADYVSTSQRSQDERYFVFVPASPDTGCFLFWYPADKLPDNDVAKAALSRIPWHGGFGDHCNGSWYDKSGRVYKGSIGRFNIPIPKYSFSNNGDLVIHE